MKIFLFGIIIMALGFSACQTEADRPNSSINDGLGRGETELSINPETRYQHIKGFGGSAGINSYNSVDRAVLRKGLEYLYSKEKGIGLTTYRYYAGAGSSNIVTLPKSRETVCIEVSPGVYDLSRDPVGIYLLDTATEMGASQVTLFMNSPPGRMTFTGQAVGHPQGKSNLKPEYYEAYADYCVGITKTFVDAGYPITYVSPINEPQWGWEKGEQEGCHYTTDEVLTVGKLVIKKVAAFDLPVTVSLPETAWWGDNAYTRGLFFSMSTDPEIRDAIDHFCSHSYGDTTRTKEDTALVIGLINSLYGKNLPLHMTEWGPHEGDEGLGSAMKLAKNLHEDLAILNCELWEFWTLMEGNTSWPGGLVYIRSPKGPVDTSKNLWVLGNYSKFVSGGVRIGLGITETEDLYASAYLCADEKTIVVVATNTGPKERAISFTGMGDKIAEVYETSASNSLTYIGDINASYGYILPSQSVTTFMFR
jgi:O-glycosyl hydrolase